MMKGRLNLFDSKNLKLKLLSLLFLVLCGCDSGCVSAGSMGSSDVTAVNVLLNPADGVDEASGVLIPKITYEYFDDSASGVCDSLWKRMNLSYNPNYDYSIAFTGSGEICNSTPSVPSTVVTILTANMIDGSNMTSYADGTDVSTLRAGFSTSSTYNFQTNDSLHGNKYDCLGEEVILYQHFGGVYAGSNYYNSSVGKNDSLGSVQSYTCNNSNGCTINTSFSDISTVEIPRGCSVTFYNKKDGEYGDSIRYAKVSVPVNTPSPYLYYATDYRFDSNQLENNCDSRGITDCITSVGVRQDSSSYVTCSTSQKTYLFEHTIGQGGDIMELSGTVSSAHIDNVPYTGDKVAGDKLTTFAVSEGCELILYDGHVSQNDPIYVPWPKIRDKTSEVFNAEILCELKNYSSWGYEVTGSTDCIQDNLHDNIKSIKIEPNTIYDALSAFAKAYPDNSNYKSDFNTLNSNGINEGALYFDGVSNFMVSDNIASYIRSNQTYKIIVTFQPVCNSCDTAELGSEARIIFATNRSNKDNLGDYLSINNNGTLSFNGQSLNINSNFYNKKIQVTISKNYTTAFITVFEPISGDVFEVSLSSLEYYNDHEYFSFGQEWDYEITPSQFFKGYLYNFSLLSSSASDSDIGAVVSILDRSSSIYNDGGKPEEISVPICISDFNFSNIQIAYGKDIISDFTVSDQEVQTNGVFNIPSGIESGDHFYFRIKNSFVSCENSLDENLALYALSTGEYNIAIKEEQDGSGLVTGLQSFIVDPIVNIFDCQATDHNDNPTDCGGFYKLFYDNIVVGTDGETTLFTFLVNTFLQFLIIMIGINVMFGLEKVSSWALVGRLIKIGLVYFLVSPGSWEFFNDYVITFVRNVPLEIGEFLTGNLAVSENVASSSQEKASMFDMLDNVSGIFLSSDVHAKIWGLLFSAPTGFLTVFLLYYSIYIFFKGMLHALIQYVVIIMMISLAIILAPFFIIFVLLPFTKDFFSKWLDMIIGSAFKLMMLSLTVILFSYLIYAYAYDMFSFAVCWKTILYCCDFLPFQFGLFEFFAPSTFDYRRFGVEEVTGTGPGFIEVFCFFIIVMIFYKFLDISDSLSDKMAGGVSVAGVGKEITKGMNDVRKSVQNTADSAVGFAYDKYHNDKGAWKRKKNNMKRDFKNSVFNAVTGEKSIEEKAAKKDLKELYNDMASEYAKEGKDMRDFEEDYKDRAKDKLKSDGKFSDKKIDKMLESNRFNQKLDNKMSQTEKDIDKQTLKDLGREMTEDYAKSNKSMANFEDEFKEKAKERLGKISTNVGNAGKTDELDKKIAERSRKAFKKTLKKKK